MASNKVPLKGYMDGIDISAWQDTIDITKVPCDFVIVKATEGTDYKNRYFAKHCDQAMKAGKLLGAFHYANGGDPHSEAEYFLAYSKKYVGKAILVLDWEGQNNPQFGRSDRAWCKEWCDYVYRKTKVKPLIYIQKSAMDNVKNLGYRLWVAQYPDYEQTGYQDHPWNEGQYDCSIRQYTSVGRLPGYEGNLDLNKSYIDKATWRKCAAIKTDSDKGKSKGKASNSNSGKSNDKNNKNNKDRKKKSIEVIAKEVIAGRWGNGEDRKKRLKTAGYDYDKVQEKVNAIVKASQKKSTDEIAREVIAGDWGNGEDRKNRLKKAGYEYDKVQKRVNELLDK